MTLMSLGPEDMRRDQGAVDRDIQPTGAAEQRMLDDWEQQIAYCQKYCELLSKKDRQFVDDLTGREPTGGRIPPGAEPSGGHYSQRRTRER